jgi:hypothetical protein
MPGSVGQAFSRGVFACHPALDQRQRSAESTRPAETGFSSSGGGSFQASHQQGYGSLRGLGRISRCTWFGITTQAQSSQKCLSSDPIRMARATRSAMPGCLSHNGPEAGRSKARRAGGPDEFPTAAKSRRGMHVGMKTPQSAAVLGHDKGGRRNRNRCPTQTGHQATSGFSQECRNTKGRASLGQEARLTGTFFETD